jgi:NTE family protein
MKRNAAHVCRHASLTTIAGATRVTAVLVTLITLVTLSPALALAQSDPAVPPTGSSPAAASPSAPRPRIGLALGGGSARGFAHIGVLKWLDEHRVPVDAVAGTSMGGVIGGAFATGMTPSEIEDMISRVAWDKLLAPGAPFPDKSFRRKEDARAFPSRLEFGLRGGFSLPAGLSAGQQVEMMLGHIAMPYYATPNFDQFPTPFRCVAADLKLGRPVVLGSGWLAQALRATMALAGVFPPVIIGDQTLVDGGILDNVPADVVAALGIDFVIAVDVSADLTYEKRGDSLVAVLRESLDVMMRAGSRRALEKADLILEPRLKGFSGTGFDHYAELIRLGYAAAASQQAALERHALSQADYQAYLDARARLRRTTPPTPTFIEADGVSPSEAAAIGTRLAGFLLRPLDQTGLDREMVALMGTERYISVGYRAVIENGIVGIRVTATPKSYGPPFLMTAVDLQNNQSSGVSATTRGRIWVTDITGRGSEARLDLAAGTIMRAGLEWYQPIGRHGFFVAPSASAGRRQSNGFTAEKYSAEYRERMARLGIDAGWTIGNRLEWRAGYAVEHLNDKILVGEDERPAVNDWQRYFSLQATYDGQTGVTIPDSGLYVRARIRRFTRAAAVSLATASLLPLGDPDNLTSAEFDSSAWFPAGPRGRVLVHAAGGASFGSTVTVNAFSLGGPFSLTALNPDEWRGSNMVLASGGYFHQLYRFAQGAGGALWAGGWLETGAAFERFDKTALKTNASVGLVVDTPLGPISASASVGFDGRYHFYAGLGPLMHKPR